MTQLGQRRWRLSTTKLAVAACFTLDGGRTDRTGGRIGRSVVYVQGKRCRSVRPDGFLHPQISSASLHSNSGRVCPGQCPLNGGGLQPRRSK
jgi:hypothetical protein